MSEDRDGGAGGAMLDLLPHEWQVLTMIDGERDLRAIAASLGRDEFEIAKIAYGLATTGIIWLRAPTRATQEFDGSGDRDAPGRGAHARRGRAGTATPRRSCVARCRKIRSRRASISTSRSRRRAAAICAAARASWEHFLRLTPEEPSAAARARGDRGVRAASSGFSRRKPMADEIRRWSDELARDPSSLVFLQLGEALRRQGQLDVALKIALRGLERHPRNVEAHDLVARIAVDRRDFARAFEGWETVLRLDPASPRRDEGAGLRLLPVRPLRRRRAVSRQGGGGRRRFGRDVGAARRCAARRAGSSPPRGRRRAGRRPADPQWLFADLLVDDGQTALLLDGNGYVLGGLYVDDEGTDLGEEIGAQLSGISDEVVRATRHLDIGDWRSITFETQVAVVAMAPAADQSLLVVAASRTTPLGLLRRLLDRCAERAAAWLGSGEGRRP